MRNKRVWMYLTEDELHRIQARIPAGESLAGTCRRIILDKVQWLEGQNYQQSRAPMSPPKQSIGHPSAQTPTPQELVDDGPTCTPMNDDTWT